jgi:hypothetical protein
VASGGEGDEPHDTVRSTPGGSRAGARRDREHCKLLLTADPGRGLVGSWRERLAGVLKHTCQLFPALTVLKGRSTNPSFRYACPRLRCVVEVAAFEP